MASTVAEQEKSGSGCSKHFLHLFDEQWFFYNVLVGSSILPILVDLKVGDLTTTKLSVQEEAVAKTEKTASRLARPLLRTPSLPPPRSGHRGIAGREEGRATGGRKLLYSYSSLDAQQSIHCSSSKMSMSLERSYRRCANPHLIMCWEESLRKAFQYKKWRSLNDLATMELQGFKDLGYVFDDMKGLSSRLVGFIPTVREMKEKEGDGRIYLSETWFTRRSAPPVVLHPVGCRSGEEMKEQLRLWAWAVACEVRQKC